MISIENGLFFLLKRIQKLAPPPHTFVFLCKGMHVLKPARLQVYSFDTVRGDLVVWDRHYPDVIPTFLQHFFLFVVFLFLVGKEATTTTTTFLHLFFAFQLHQSSSPSSSYMHVFPWNLDSLLHVKMQNFFLPAPSLLKFFSFKQIISAFFFYFIFFQTVHHPPKKKKKKKRSKKKKKKKTSSAQRTWFMVGMSQLLD